MSKVINKGDIYIVADKITMFSENYIEKDNITEFIISLIGDDEPLYIIEGGKGEKFEEKLINAIEG